MSTTDASRNLELLDTAPADDGGGCGCGGCGCNDTGTARSPGTTAEATADKATKESDMTTETYSVTGMTCGHCASAVTTELAAFDGVSGVQVGLVAGGTSTVTVTSQQPLDRTQVSAALEEAGDYRLA